VKTGCSGCWLLLWWAAGSCSGWLQQYPSPTTLMAAALDADQVIVHALVTTAAIQHTALLSTEGPWQLSLAQDCSTVGGAPSHRSALPLEMPFAPISITQS
jgi:hypothetical protein